MSIYAIPYQKLTFKINIESDLYLRNNLKENCSKVWKNIKMHNYLVSPISGIVAVVEAMDIAEW